MKLNLTIDYQVEEADPEVEGILEEIVAEEARGLGEVVRRRLAEAGVTDISMMMTESPK